MKVSPRRAAAVDGVRPSGGHGFTAQLTLQDVPPGRYVVQLDARSDAGSGATATRAIPITVR